jgi:hypothetical protein
MIPAPMMPIATLFFVMLTSTEGRGV